MVLTEALAKLHALASAEGGCCSEALGVAMAALQTIQGMEPITHEITLAHVMAQHATDALEDISTLCRSRDEPSPTGTK